MPTYLGNGLGIDRSGNLVSMRPPSTNLPSSFTGGGGGSGRSSQQPQSSITNPTPSADKLYGTPEQRQAQLDAFSKGGLTAFNNAVSQAKAQALQEEKIKAMERLKREEAIRSELIRLKANGSVQIGNNTYIGNAFIKDVGMSANEYRRTIIDRALKEGLVNVEDIGRTDFAIDNRKQKREEELVSIKTDINQIDTSQNYGFINKAKSNTGKNFFTSIKYSENPLRDTFVTLKNIFFNSGKKKEYEILDKALNSNQNSSQIASSIELQSRYGTEAVLNTAVELKIGETKNEITNKYNEKYFKLEKEYNNYIDELNKDSKISSEDKEKLSQVKLDNINNELKVYSEELNKEGQKNIDSFAKKQNVVKTISQFPELVVSSISPVGRILSTAEKLKLTNAIARSNVEFKVGGFIDEIELKALIKNSETSKQIIDLFGGSSGVRKITATLVPTIETDAKTIGKSLSGIKADFLVKTDASNNIVKAVAIGELTGFRGFIPISKDILVKAIGTANEGKITSEMLTFIGKRNLFFGSKAKIINPIDTLNSAQVEDIIAQEGNIYGFRPDAVYKDIQRTKFEIQNLAKDLNLVKTETGTTNIGKISISDKSLLDKSIQLENRGTTGLLKEDIVKLATETIEQSPVSLSKYEELQETIKTSADIKRINLEIKNEQVKIEKELASLGLKTGKIKTIGEGKSIPIKELPEYKMEVDAMEELNKKIIADLNKKFGKIELRLSDDIAKNINKVEDNVVQQIEKETSNNAKAINSSTSTSSLDIAFRNSLKEIDNNINSFDNMITQGLKYPIDIQNKQVKLPINRETSKSITVTRPEYQFKEMEIEIQKLNQDISNSIKNITAQNPVKAQSNRVSQKTEQIPKLSEKQITKLKQDFPINPYPNIDIPRISIPNLPNIPILAYKTNKKNEKEKTRKDKRYIEGYFVFVKLIKSNSYKKINQTPLTKSRCEDIGAYYILNSLSRTFEVKKANARAEEDYEFMIIPENYYENNYEKIRNYRIKNKNIIPKESTYIQKSKYALSSKAEQEDIQKFRNSIKNIMQGRR